MAGQIVTVFGGTGFLGRRVASRLLGLGLEARAASGSPSRLPPARGFQWISADIDDEAQVAAAIAGSYGVVNAISLYRERGRETCNAIIVPPAVMFGPGDAFLNTLVQFLRRLPAYPLFGRGQPRLQPVYVEDVAEAIARALLPGAACRATYGDPRTFAYEELLVAVAERLRKRPALFSVSMARARMVRGEWHSAKLHRGHARTDSSAVQRPPAICARRSSGGS